MPETLLVATTQMEVAPAPTEARLARAAALVAEAAEAGARLVVLPELFNTGYAYTEENYQRAEPLDGPTLRWMEKMAVQHGIYLAGSLLLLDQSDIYNALFLVAPDGQRWRYDKLYPWGWERGYFREGHAITIAETALGRIGLLICWDVGHRDLWQRYAGDVDFMVISSCPPNLPDSVYTFPNGERLNAHEMGPVFEAVADEGPAVFVEMVREQTAWMSVPTVQAGGCGQFESAIPRGFATVLAMVPFAPRLARYLWQARGLRSTCAMLPAAYVLDAEGSYAARLPQDIGESYALAEITLPDKIKRPSRPQPRSRASWFGTLVSDVVLTWLTIPLYRRSTRKAHGSEMAPPAPSARRWKAGLLLSALTGFGIGWLMGRRRRR